MLTGRLMWVYYHKCEIAVDQFRLTDLETYAISDWRPTADRVRHFAATSSSLQQLCAVDSGIFIWLVRCNAGQRRLRHKTLVRWYRCEAAFTPDTVQRHGVVHCLASRCVALRRIPEWTRLYSFTLRVFHVFLIAETLLSCLSHTGCFPARLFAQVPYFLKGERKHWLFRTKKTIYRIINVTLTCRKLSTTVVSGTAEHHHQQWRN